MKEQALSQLSEWLHELNITTLSPVIQDRLWLYFLELQRWGAKMNLVAKASELQIIETHFLDSLTLLPLIDAIGAPPVKKILDVGSGAGFPGLVLKIARPDDLDVTLLEPRQKRSSFLKHVIRTVKLSGVAVVTERLEQDSSFTGTHGQFPIITSRALASVNDFLNMSEPISPAGGLIICMKGPKAEEEVQEWRAKSPNSPFKLNRHQKIYLPLSGAARELLIFEKAA